MKEEKKEKDNKDGSNNEVKAVNYLDDMNNARVTIARKTVKRIMLGLRNAVECLKEGRILDYTEKRLAESINGLSEQAEELGYACEHFGWNIAVVLKLEDAIGDLGEALAMVQELREGNEDGDYDASYAGTVSGMAFNKLGMVLGTLTTWFDDDNN